MSVQAADKKQSLDSAPDEIQEMLNRAIESPGLADVLRVYSSLDQAVGAFRAYTTAQLMPPQSSSSATIA